MLRIKTIIVLLGIFLTANLLAFPELVRRGYGNCAACHVSPSGGGLLTPYGRALTSEVLTTAGSPEESKFLYGWIEPPAFLNLGGDVRFLTSFMNSSHGQKFNAIPMQADLEGAATVGRFTLDATGGIDFNGGGNFISRRHYLLYKPSDEISFRAGRFMPAYGINTEQHALAIRRGLGQDQGGESYNLEAAWIGEAWNFYLTAIFGRPDNPNLGAETGVAASASLFFSDSYKAGLSYYQGSRSATQRQLAGPFAILGFAPNFFVLAEIDFQWLSSPTGHQWGLVDDLRLDYEVIPGLHFYLTQEMANLFLDYPANYSDAYGIGVQFFPRPHYEINVLYQKLRAGGSATPFADFVWAMLHLYF